MSTEPVMQIGEVAARTGSSLRSLRYWEDLGLLEPSGRSARGFRLYTQADVEKILFVHRMQQFGFSLDELRAVIADLEILGDPAEDPGARDAADQRLNVFQQDAATRLQTLTQDLTAADTFINLIRRTAGGA